MPHPTPTCDKEIFKACLLVTSHLGSVKGNVSQLEETDPTVKIQTLHPKSTLWTTTCPVQREGRAKSAGKEQKLAPVLRKQHKCFVSLGIRTTYRFKPIKSKSYASKPNTNLPQRTITSQLISPLWPLKTSVWFGSLQAHCKAALQFLWHTVGCDTTLIHLLLNLYIALFLSCLRINYMEMNSVR